MSQPYTWCIMPILGARDYTIAAVADLLNQTVPTRILLINQGVDDDFRQELEQTAEAVPDRIFLWSHVPPLPSLSATWNRALDFVWASGGDEALVVNNDVRLHKDTVRLLSLARRYDEALFVSCVGVTETQFSPDLSYETLPKSCFVDNGPDLAKGGPDFSCFLISYECHQKYRFDEQFIPAFCEDLDYHRRLMLGGDRERIFSINLPYLHYGSATLKTVQPATKARIEREISQYSRAYYQKKWGGAVNEETFLEPFGGGFSEPAKVTDGSATTPFLQHT